jgi:hypothetical protein
MCEVWKWIIIVTAIPLTVMGVSVTPILWTRRGMRRIDERST